MKVNVEVKGMKEAQEATKNLEKLIPDIVGGGLRRVTLRAVKSSRPNAPILTGKMRKNMRAKPVVVDRRTTKGDGGVETNGVHYAMKMHEGAYNLGPVSKAQPPTKEGGVGRKFVSRVVERYGRKEYLKEILVWSMRLLKQKEIIK